MVLVLIFLRTHIGPCVPVFSAEMTAIGVWVGFKTGFLAWVG